MVKFVAGFLLVFFLYGAEIEFRDLQYNKGRSDSTTSETSFPPPAAPAVTPQARDYRPVGLGRAADNRCQEAYLSQRGGKYGPRAQMLIEEILASPMRQYFFDNVRGLEKVCPRFNSMNQEQKLNFWVALFTHLGDFESDCRDWLYNSCTGGRCGGDFQVPAVASRRHWRVPREYRSAYRGKGCQANYGSGQGGHWVTGQRNNIACAVQIMAGQLCGFYTKKGAGSSCGGLTSPFARGYWQPINEGKVKARLKEFSLCAGGGK